MRVFVDAEGLDSAPVALLETAVRHALRRAGAGDAEISVTLLGDEPIRALNRDYLDRDRPTDVIAFSLGEAAGEGGPAHVGDVYVGFERAREQAADHGVTLDEELVRLVIHGTLHVLGHDHPHGPDRAACPMFELQERLVREVCGGS